MGNREREKRAKLSAKPAIEARPLAGRGIGAVQLPDGVQFYRFKKTGTVRLDVIPFKISNPRLHPHSPDGTWYERTYFIHRSIGAESVTVICPKATFNKPCPICDCRTTLDRNDEEEAKQIRALYPQERQLYNVIVHEAGKSSEVMILDQPRKGFGKKIDDMIQGADDEDQHYQYFADLEDGSTLKINVDELNAGTFKYFGATSIEFKQRKTHYDDSILKKTIDLDTVIHAMPYEELKDLFQGTGNYDPANQSDDEEPQPPKKSTKSSKQTEDDSDDDESPTPPKKPAKAKPPVDDDEDDDADSNEPPVKQKAKAKALVDDDDDDDEPPKTHAKSKAKQLPDEDDEPPPKSKSSTASPGARKHLNVETWDDDDDD